MELLCQQVRAFLKFRVCISCFSQCLQKCMSPTVSLMVSVYDMFWFIHSFIGNCSPQIKGRVLKIGRRVLKIGRRVQKASLGTSLGCSEWEFACQRRGQGFDPWCRNLPPAAEQLSLCAATTEALEPGSRNYWACPPRACAPQRETPPPWEAHAAIKSIPPRSN